MGWGDIKLLMMTSAFLGADSCIYILAGGAMLGFLYAFIRKAAAASRAATKSRRVERKFTPKAPDATKENPQEGALPFAPFLAVPTLFWMAVGNWLYLLYKMCA